MIRRLLGTDWPVESRTTAVTITVPRITLARAKVAERAHGRRSPFVAGSTTYRTPRTRKRHLSGISQRLSPGHSRVDPVGMVDEGEGEAFPTQDGPRSWLRWLDPRLHPLVVTIACGGIAFGVGLALAGIPGHGRVLS